LGCVYCRTADSCVCCGGFAFCVCANQRSGKRIKSAFKLIFLYFTSPAPYKKPEILILDEATSSLDSESESFVQKTIQMLKNQGKTIIIIAHRLSTVINADNIIVLENGKIMEQGNHHNLYAQFGRYYLMWQKQSANI